MTDRLSSLNTCSISGEQQSQQWHHTQDGERLVFVFSRTKASEQRTWVGWCGLDGRHVHVGWRHVHVDSHSRADHAAFSLSLALPAILQAYSANTTLTSPTSGLVGGAAAVDNDAVAAVVFSELRQRLVSDGQMSTVSRANSNNMFQRES